MCTDTFLTLCTGRFAPQTACEDLVPSCGNWHSCTHRVDLYDIYGDGWTGATLDVYVGNWPVLAGITLVDGAGPAPYYFEAAAGDEISTIYHAHGEWPEEAFYVIVSGRDVVLAQDGEGSTEPTGVTVVGDCPEPCGDLDLDFDVDLYDYDLFCDSFGQCRSEQAYMELRRPGPGRLRHAVRPGTVAGVLPAVRRLSRAPASGPAGGGSVVTLRSLSYGQGGQPSPTRHPTNGSMSNTFTWPSQLISAAM